jgi:two-component system CheB/CheR fusion protein
MKLKGTRILVVDDVLSVRVLLGGLLRLEGADVAESATGWRAAELVRERPFDVVITDLGLPDIPGDVLIAHVRNASKGRTRVAALTGYGEPHQTRARAAGADAVFTKPVDWETIVAFAASARVRDTPRSGVPVVPALDLPLSA